MRFVRTALAVTLLSACAGDGMSRMTSASADGAVVLGVSPANGALQVDPASPITVDFSRPMMSGMELLVTLHQGGVQGPAVEGTASWSQDRTRLTFTPAAPLQSQTTYVLHLSPGLTDVQGRQVNYAGCTGTGRGQPAPAGMMGPRRDGSGQWAYGMVFVFTTA